MADATEQNASGHGASLMVSYQELVTIRTMLATITAQLQAALALQGKVDALEKRVGYLERGAAGDAGARRVWNTIVAFVAGVVTMALGGGALKILPMLWGG